MVKKRFALELITGLLALFLIFLVPKYGIFSLLLFFVIPIASDKRKFKESEKEIFLKANSFSIVFTSIFTLIFLILNKFVRSFHFKFLFHNFNWVALIVAILLISNGGYGFYLSKKGYKK